MGGEGAGALPSPRSLPGHPHHGLAVLARTANSKIQGFTPKFFAVWKSRDPVRKAVFPENELHCRLGEVPVNIPGSWSSCRPEFCILIHILAGQGGISLSTHPSPPWWCCPVSNSLPGKKGSGENLFTELPHKNVFLSQNRIFFSLPSVPGVN